jgi:protein-tyrosine phosphatase
VAEALKAELADCPYRVESAGFHPREGRASPDAWVRRAADLGLDLSGHRSRVVTADEVAGAELCVIMDRKNWWWLDRIRPSAARSALWLGAYGPGRGAEIADPYGHDEATQGRLMDELLAAAASLVRRLKAVQPATRGGVLPTSERGRDAART